MSSKRKSKKRSRSSKSSTSVSSECPSSPSLQAAAEEEVNDENTEFFTLPPAIRARAAPAASLVTPVCAGEATETWAAAAGTESLAAEQQEPAVTAGTDEDWQSAAVRAQAQATADQHKPPFRVTAAVCRRDSKADTTTCLSCSIPPYCFRSTTNGCR